MLGESLNSEVRLMLSMMFFTFILLLVAGALKKFLCFACFPSRVIRSASLKRVLGLEQIYVISLKCSKAFSISSSLL